jgi:hypothetical protein
MCKLNLRYQITMPRLSNTARRLSARTSASVFSTSRHFGIC